MKKNKSILGLVVVLALAVVVFVFRDRIQFNWAAFGRQLRYVSLGHAAFGIVLIYLTYVLRAWRWAVFVSPTKKVNAAKLIGPQFIGFTAVAIFGRLADLTRPYLLAKRTELSVSSQIAVYTVERMFDLGCAAIVFSSAMAFTPKTLPHHEVFLRVGLGSLAVTFAMVVFAFTVRLAGGAVASFTRAVLGRLSKPVAESVATKILGFRDGLNTIASVKEFVLVLALSLVIWGMIAFSYFETVHAFVATPQLATVSFSRTMLLMAASIGSGLLTLPVIGWFTQIAATAATMQAFFGAPIESATACGAVLLIVTTLCIVPIGLIFAQLEQVSLKQVATESSSEAPAEVVE